MNYSNTSNCYLYVKLISGKVKLKKSNYQNIDIAHAQNVHIQIEFRQQNTFNIRIATAKYFCHDCGFLIIFSFLQLSAFFSNPTHLSQVVLGSQIKIQLLIWIND